MKISLARLLEETLGISKITTKEELTKLLEDKDRMQAAVDAIKASAE